MDQLSKRTELLKKVMADGLSEKDFLNLYNTGQVRGVKAGGHLFREGDQHDILFFVVNGKCRIEPNVEGGYGEEVFFQDGDWIGELLFFQTPMRLASVAAVTPTIVLMVDGRTFRTLPSETQSYILKKLNDQAMRRLRMFTRRYAWANRVNAHLTRTIRDQYEARAKDYEHSEVLQNVLKSIPELPIYVTKLVQLLLNENASVRDIAALAKDDPSLTGQILKTVNSSLYGLSTKIADLNHAILYLGFNEVYQIVVAAGLLKTMPDTREFQELHEHSMTISHLAFEICEHYNKQKSSIISTIAILHDIGKSVILLFRKQNPQWSIFMEMLDPAKVGAMLLTQWNIPEMVSETIELQDYPSFMPPSELPTRHADCVAILFLAQIGAGILEGDVLNPADYPFLRHYLKVLKLDDVAFTEFFASKIIPALNNKARSIPAHLLSLVRNYHGEQPGRTL